MWSVKVSGVYIVRRHAPGIVDQAHVALATQSLLDETREHERFITKSLEYDISNILLTVTAFGMRKT